jgi:BlaI family transcriptional regulator, penicillinase repressor
MGKPQLAGLQLRIMQVLWSKPKATAREITDEINASSGPIAHSTVQTMLRVLEEKKAVSHESEGRTFFFVPLVKENEFKQSATRDLLERVFGGSVSDLVAHLLKTENVSPDEMHELRKMIKRQPKR